MNQIFFKSVYEQVDSWTMHKVLGLLEKSLRNNEMVEIYLSSCTHGPKQRIYIPDFMGRDDYDICINTFEPADVTLVAYKYSEGTEKTIVVAIAEEVEALAGV